MPPSTATELARLDGALVALRRLWEGPAVRRRFEALLGSPVDLGLIRTLRAIERATEEPGVGAIADILRVDQSTASRAVDAAVAGGYVARTPSTADRRRCVLTLTDVGEDLLDVARNARTTLLAEITDGWPEEDVAALARLLDRFVTAFADTLETSS